MEKQTKQCPTYAEAPAGRQNCKKICQNCKSEFAIEPEDFDFYEKIEVPPPTWCPACREQRRLVFRNERALYKRKCDLCGESVVSRVSPDKPYPMYCQKCWWSDKWNPLSYGRNYDWSRPFLEQFRELLFFTPHVNILNSNTVNSDWVNQETDDKNCYLNVGGHFNEDSAYNTYEIRGKNCLDNFWVWQTEFGYENIIGERCYRTLFSRDCYDCLNVILSSDCRNCQNCFGCAGLRNKQYHIFNQPSSKEEYQEFLKNNPLTSNKNLAALQEKARKVWLSVPKRNAHIIKCNNVKGCFINESKNIGNGWYVDKCEDSKHLYVATSLKDCYDATSFGWAELCYEMAHSVGASNSKFSAFIMGGGTAEAIGSTNLEYCYATPHSSNCFGCCNMKGQEYCILNKKYSKESFDELRTKIKQQMIDMPYTDKKGRVYAYGEFFPVEFAPFGYNETTAQDYYPLEKAEAIERGYNWSDYESDVKYEFSDYQAPDDIHDVKDDILEKVLKCEVSSKAYRIIPMELQLYRQIGLPIPKRTPLQRHRDRMKELLPRKLFQRPCQCQGESSEKGIYKNTAPHSHGNTPCPNLMETPYSPDRPEIVYCEACYLKEIA
ncbi:MAG: hypothetical protein PHN39_02360 [Candidatus Pacebacteria bacterium]|nr:hypothetical protein [Candidatus Paceibacterota bacterium]